MTKEAKTAVIIPAAGSGKRMGGGIPKQYGNLGGMSILARTVKAFADLNEIHQISIVTNEDYLERCRLELKNLGLMSKVREILTGGQERQDSIYRAIQRLPEDVDLVLVHDGVRPFVTGEVIRRTIEAAKLHGAAVAAVPVKDTIKMAEENLLTKTLDRRSLYSVQTPQGFRKDLLVHAYDEAYRKNYYGTDDAVLVEKVGEKVHIVKGDYNNIKITTMEDIVFGEAILGGWIENSRSIGFSSLDDIKMEPEEAAPGEEGETRIGTGYDVHKLVRGRKLILGGVEIPFERGLLGHSDADVLTHAVMDALLGAAALGDIGKHFPDTDEKYRGISSITLLEVVGSMLTSKGYCIVNIDATVVAQKPKIAPHISDMISIMARALKMEEKRINIKGTTTEKLGFCGRGEGIAAQASVLIKRRI
ncbi:2-C-methyl-D-erythritol 4-phosphate cytidylyltransferase [Sinanaerobacter chloroacetimidivorans]|jgi:2-C-methyl-D-erythritol 4-phosphate cytidylyltransferase/2-C-methyl-D-erythritol 2,4-cyclodiphosphate synthase|uniref:Bifunctional enzyme IspD/IspF n=1 Tax=Sinanaerobacter chloroacetimidivorans TaxID=2818044 RepID=A0A8J8B487_9FIRM|nr:2-C-methyl-D-erythritol 4-phosphate cytidylyltransferase [Sinanaerobacter chloroacetimidivorans]MBR0600472.1 2-C-methyl-D-erythritol 2,4-cyclodiphosphate synthase [Sinanaerobacter chloroacetimidivorans]